MFDGITFEFGIKILISTIGLGLGIYLGKFAKNFFRWVKGGIEDGDGVLQNKELQIAWFSLLCAFLVISIAIFNVTYPDAVIYCTFGAATGMYLGRQFTEKGKKDDKKDDGEF